MLKTEAAPKAKYSGTRSQPKRLYFLALATLSLATVFGVSNAFATNPLSYISSPFRNAPSIQWRTRDEAMAESRRTHKPILYVLLYKDDLNSIRMEYDDLHRASTVAYVKDNFIPVKIKLDSAITDMEEQPEFKAISKQVTLQYNRQMQLAVVPAEMIDFNQEDLVSSANFAERGIFEVGENAPSAYNYDDDYDYGGFRRNENELTAPHHFPVMRTYDNNESLMHFLFVARNWHKLPPSRGLAHWQPLEVLKQPRGAKNRVLFMVNKYGRDSDMFRMTVLNDPRFIHKLEANCVPILVEYDNIHPEKTAHLDYLKKQYGVDKLPTTVAIDAKQGEPFESTASDGSGLETFLRVNGSLPAVPGVITEAPVQHRRIKYPHYNGR